MLRCIFGTSPFMTPTEKPMRTKAQTWKFLFALLILAGSSTHPPTARSAEPAVAPRPGDPAPDFSLPYATADTIVAQGEPLREAVRKGPVVLAFYPADWSPGCTREVCTLRDAFTDLAGLNATIWAISGDQVYSHKAWAAAQHLPFRLLSDQKHEVATAYGSFNTETGFNRRTAFIVGRDGRIAYADPAYSVQDQKSFEALKAALAKVQH